jgi:hypothetical protein
LPRIPRAPPECRSLASYLGWLSLNLLSSVVTSPHFHGLLEGGTVENTSSILTIKEVASILRCSKTHALNVLEGRVRGLPKLAHLSLGRRKVVRKDWLDEWMEANKRR